MNSFSFFGFFFLSYSLSVASHRTSERRLCLYILSWILLVVFSNSSIVRSLTSTNKIKQLKEKKKELFSPLVFFLLQRVICKERIKKILKKE